VRGGQRVGGAVALARVDRARVTARAVPQVEVSPEVPRDLDIGFSDDTEGDVALPVGGCLAVVVRRVDLGAEGLEPRLAREHRHRATSPRLEDPEPPVTRTAGSTRSRRG